MKQPLKVILTDTHLKEENIEVVKSIFKQATVIAKEFGFNSIDHAGDIFNSRRSQSQLVLTSFRDILDELQEDGMILNSIKGNHDCTEYSISKSFLDPFSSHPAFNLYPVSAVTVLTKEIDFHYLSHFSQEIYIEELLKLKESINPEKKTVLLSHNDIDSGVMNNGTVVSSKVTADLFKGYELCLFGHWHDYQEIHYEGGVIKFISASLQHNFGELTGKGLTILFDDLSTEIRELKYPQYLKFEINPKDITAKDIQELKEEKNSSGDNLRIILTGTESEVKSFNKMDLMNAGISVEMKQDKIDKEEIESQLEAFDTKSLQEEFNYFCDKNKLDRETGMKYFNKILTAV